MNSGGEIISPILYDSLDTWEELGTICSYLSEKGAVTTEMAGGHIHIGAHILGDNIDNWRRFAKLYMLYENVIFRFVYGDKISGREKILYYAQPIADSLYRKMSDINNSKTISDIENSFPTDTRYQSINFKNVNFGYVTSRYSKNTLELRCPNASVNEVVWQNNINTFAKSILAATSDDLDEDFLNFKIKKEKVSSKRDFYMYNEICMKSALEFVDLVFDNNLDKVYFLRQYFKGFQDNFGYDTAVMAKSFVKKVEYR